MDQYNIILCEGAAEQAIMDILLKFDKLIVKNNDSLIGNRPLRIRSVKNLCNQYLNKSYDFPIIIYRILDSKNEKFDEKYIKKNYKHRVEVVNIITSPEIEVLMLIVEDEYDVYKNNKGNIKPSEYCKNYLVVRV